MKTAPETQNSLFSSPEWDIIGEFPLLELLVDMDVRDEPQAGLLYKATQVLGLRPELLDILERKLIEFATQAPAQLNQRRFNAPTFIRIFFERNAIGDSNKPSSPSVPMQSNNSVRMLHHFGPEIIEGWGYFMVERGVSSLECSSAIMRNWVELFLYKEGE